jgi:enoyl-CoA hydratase
VPQGRRNRATRVIPLEAGELIDHADPILKERPVEVRHEASDGVAVVTLAAPQRRNALTPEMARELVEVLDTVDADDSVAAVVITGEGRGFCAGANTSTLSDAGTNPLADDNFLGLSDIYAAFSRLGAMRAPTIAAVKGAAVGAGLNLALAADLRIVATDVRLMSGFLRIGIHPGGGHFHLLDRFLSRDAVTALGIFGEELDGEAAVRLGLAWRSVPADDVLDTAVALAGRVGADPELARSAVRTLRLEIETGMSWESAVQFERAAQMRSLWRRDSRAASTNS